MDTFATPYGSAPVTSPTFCASPRRGLLDSRQSDSLRGSVPAHSGVRQRTSVLQFTINGEVWRHTRRWIDAETLFGATGIGCAGQLCVRRPHWRSRNGWRLPAPYVHECSASRRCKRSSPVTGVAAEIPRSRATDGGRAATPPKRARLTLKGRRVTLRDPRRAPKLCTERDSYGR